MYHPYFRGKQFDLLTIREMAPLLSEVGFRPIIEPVRDVLGGLKKSLDAVVEAGGRAVVIVNPRHGDLSGAGTQLSDLLKENFLDMPGISAGILLKHDMSTAETLDCFEQHSSHSPVLIHAGFGEAKALSDGLGIITKDQCHVFFQQYCGKLYLKHFKSGHRVLLRDGFERKRNRDYEPLEKFSELLDRLEALLSPLTLDLDELPTVWYRARIRPGDVPYPVDQMGAPPNRSASHGRANPAGIPYLYLGSAPNTAISEIRPHTGEMACVADFATPPDLKLVDLRSPRTMVSPFLLADADDIGRMRNDLPFLERLGNELTRPVIPQSAAIDYTPSQYLCEFVKKCGYQGVIYRSSVSHGMNLALFDPSLAKCGTVAQYRVSRVNVEIILDGA